MKKCVFAGTFDPFTAGHADTVQKCLSVFDEVIVCVGENPSKHTMFSSEERREMIEGVYRGEPRVRVLVWEGAIARLLEREGTPFYVRGIRSGRDFDYETADFYASKKLYPLISVYFPAEQSLLHISSTIVRNSIVFHTPFEDYVPREVYEYIKSKGYLYV